jgi:thiol-disulfide isomerase/thioredoxin
MNKKGLLITLVIFLVVLGVAGVLYPKLSAGMQNQQLATVPTTEPTEAVTEATQPEKQEETQPETTEPTEPQTVAAPDFTVLDWDGNEVKFSDFVGKPIVLNFWAHWCGPCQMEMPEFNAAYERLGGEVTFLMVHEGAAVEDGKDKVTEGGYTFPVVFDVDSSAGNLYGISAFPTTFFIDKDGYLQAYYMGAMDADLLQQGLDIIYTENNQ